MKATTTAGLALSVFVMTLLGASAANASCEQGRETCRPGYVWREAFPGDHVCVPRASHDRVVEDNALAASRRSAGGGAYGPDTCMPGYVWREASPADHVCVPGDTRDRTGKENALANDRLDPSCVSPPVIRSTGDKLMAVLQSRKRVLTALTMFGIGAFLLILITNPLATAHPGGGIALKAAGSLVYALMVWLWPVLCALPDYYMRQNGDPVYRVAMSSEFLNELGLDPAVALGMAAFCLAAIVLGNSALKEIRGSAERLMGASMAQTGRALGYLTVVPLVIWWVLLGLLGLTLPGLAH